MYPKWRWTEQSISNKSEAESYERILLWVEEPFQFSVKVLVVSCGWFSLSLESDNFLLCSGSLHFLLMPGEPPDTQCDQRNMGSFQCQSFPFPLFQFYNCRHLLIHSDLSSPQITEVLGLSLTVIILKEECWMWKKITCLRSLCQIPLDGEISVAAVPRFYFSILNVKLLFNGF